MAGAKDFAFDAFGLAAAAPPPQSAQAAAQGHVLRAFWAQQQAEMAATTDFKTHNLPLARIKKIMKSDEDVRMISSEAPALFAKACEMFILEARRPARAPSRGRHARPWAQLASGAALRGPPRPSLVRARVTRSLISPPAARHARPRRPARPNTLSPAG